MKLYLKNGDLAGETVSVAEQLRPGTIVNVPKLSLMPHQHWIYYKYLATEDWDRGRQVCIAAPEGDQ